MGDIMVNVLGYSIKEQIYAGTRTLVYRAIREKDLQTVIIKLIRNEYPSFSEIVQFRNQYTIALNLDIPGIVKPYSLETHYNGCAFSKPLMLKRLNVKLFSWFTPS